MYLFYFHVVSIQTVYKERKFKKIIDSMINTETITVIKIAITNEVSNKTYVVFPNNAETSKLPFYDPNICKKKIRGSYPTFFLQRSCVLLISSSIILMIHSLYFCYIFYKKILFRTTHDMTILVIHYHL